MQCFRTVWDFFLYVFSHRTTQERTHMDLVQDPRSKGSHVLVQCNKPRKLSWPFSPTFSKCHGTTRPCSLHFQDKMWLFSFFWGVSTSYLKKRPQQQRCASATCVLWSVLFFLHVFISRRQIQSSGKPRTQAVWLTWNLSLPSVPYRLTTSPAQTPPLGSLIFP